MHSCRCILVENYYLSLRVGFAIFSGVKVARLQGWQECKTSFRIFIERTPKLKQPLLHHGHDFLKSGIAI